MKLKNLVVFVLVGAGVAYGGVKGFIYYKVKKQVDQLVVAARPFADIEYGSIGSDFQGQVVINKLVVYPLGAHDGLHAEQLTVITPGLKYLLTGADSVKKGELPERMGIALTGAHLNLRGSLTEMLEQAEAEQLGHQPAEDIACSLSSNFLTAQYRELGFDELVFDTRFTFERGLSASQIIFKIDYAIRDLEQAEFVVTLEGFGNSVMSLAVASPQMKRVTMNYKPDAAFTRKTREYCAGKLGVDQQTFVNGLFEKSDEQYIQELGIVPGPGIRAAMKELMQNAGELSIVAQPASTLDLKTVGLYRPKDWPALFGLIVKVNDKEISDLSFTLPDANAGKGNTKTAKRSLPGPGLVGQKKQARPVPAKTAKNSSVTRSSAGRQQYRVVAHRDVNTLVGKHVRIATTDGKRRSGHVLSVENGIISLQMRTHGGLLSTRVPVATASKIEVLERS